MLNFINRNWSKRGCLRCLYLPLCYFLNYEIFKNYFLWHFLDITLIKKNSGAIKQNPRNHCRAIFGCEIPHKGLEVHVNTFSNKSYVVQYDNCKQYANFAYYAWAK